MVPIKIGKTYAGSDVTLSFDSHILIAGRSGSGKTSLLDLLITQMYASDPTAQFYLFGMNLIDIAKYKKLVPITWELKRYAARIQNLVQHMNKRIIECVNSNVTIYKKNPIYLVFYDYADVTSGSTKEEIEYAQMINSGVAEIARKGRIANMHLIISAPYPTAKICPTIIKEQCGVRMCMRMHDSSGYVMMLGHMPDIIPMNSPGNCVIKHENGYEQTFQATYASFEYVNSFTEKYSNYLPEWYIKELAKTNKIT